MVVGGEADDTEWVKAAVTFLTSIQEVQFFIFGRSIGYSDKVSRDIPHFLRAIAALVPRLGPYLFLPIYYSSVMRPFDII
jgi:hypothetical protein